MKYIYDIRPYSCYDNWTKASDSDNISGIIDKLIRITAKVTEYYASDIYYDILDLNAAIQMKLPYDKVLIFRECGVNRYDAEDNTVSYPNILDGIQVWRIVHDPDKPYTMLTRVYLSGDHNIVGM